MAEWSATHLSTPMGGRPRVTGRVSPPSPQDGTRRCSHARPPEAGSGTGQPEAHAEAGGGEGGGRGSRLRASAPSPMRPPLCSRLRWGSPRAGSLRSPGRAGSEPREVRRLGLRVGRRVGRPALRHDRRSANAWSFLEEPRLHTCSSAPRLNTGHGRPELAAASGRAGIVGQRATCTKSR